MSTVTEQLREGRKEIKAYLLPRRDVQASVERLRAENAATREQMDAMAKFVSQHCIGLAGEGYHVHRRLDAPDAT